MSRDEEIMCLALEKAKHWVGCTAPNPPVGAALVYADEVVAIAAHQQAGTPHAERHVLRLAKEKGLTREQFEKSILYVTLEPCSTEGRTGACTRAILEHGVAKVVYGSTDPNKAHQGAAKRILEKAGIEVIEGVLKDECDHLIRAFAKVQGKGLPWVIMKTAFSLDGKVSRAHSEERWLSGPESRAEVHQLRSQVEAVLVGGETVRCDNPALTIRGIELPKEKQQPLRIVVTRSGEGLDVSKQLLSDIYKDRTRVYYQKELEDVLRDLVEKEQVQSVLVEAGPQLQEAFLQAGLVDEWVAYVTPYLCGGPYPADARLDCAFPWFPEGLSGVSLTSVGADLCVRGIF